MMSAGFHPPFIQRWKDLLWQVGCLRCEEINQAIAIDGLMKIASPFPTTWMVDRIFSFSVSLKMQPRAHGSKNRAIILEHCNHKNANVRRDVPNSARRFGAIDDGILTSIRIMSE